MKYVFNPIGEMPRCEYASTCMELVNDTIQGRGADMINENMTKMA